MMNISGKVDARLHEECVPGDGACQDPDAECVGEEGSGTCECKQEFVDDGGICQKGYEKECNETEECVSNANCEELSDIYFCICSSGFVPEDELCKVPVGGNCRQDTDCVNNANCTEIQGSQECACDVGFMEEGSSCRLPILGEGCLSDPGPGCNPGQECSPNEDGQTTCQCPDGFVEQGINCRVPPGGDCVEAEDCVSNAACYENSCMCNLNYVPDDTSGLCRKVNADLDQYCDPGEGECKDPNAECVGNEGLETCKCKSGYLYDGGICKIPAGENCSGVGDCVSHAYCQGSPIPKCECNYGYVIESGLCKKKAGESCTLMDEDCVENSTCNAGLGNCKCNEGYVEDNGRCRWRIHKFSSYPWRERYSGLSMRKRRTEPTYPISLQKFLSD
ncbi:unnamed protein product [Darwinula stevensoni]|uniref:EGF-like domain-containing protein n=1 Tax=Darwinula stevensoni TaxID=69355 RepID=A0A7R9FRM8_9CRUS|nr:unnamed protein product [Darwinula stevensoni]CAG0901593.1 unnamed protein product [Darwinula stevensoni]